MFAAVHTVRSCVMEHMDVQHMKYVHVIIHVGVDLGSAVGVDTDARACVERGV